ncbi:unnamed protein product [Ambrosiozyma monospora]|uniref:Unnamed protein product n=1 Tax=Ambrosiozyma monospora TaxID=43982 RepID=A0ACB5SWY0_AMBMO|nr:unnamed protein product [Ambrosiozyma monospora]
MDIYASNESLKIEIETFLAFFIIDRTLSTNIQYTIRTKKQADDLYSSVLTKFIPALKHHVKRHSADRKDLEELSYILGTMCQILDNWKFDTSSLYDVMMELFTTYIDLLIKDFTKNYRELSEEDGLQPFVVSDDTQFNNLKKRCFYVFKEDTNITFPKTLPFSLLYPATCVSVRSFINDVYQFLSKYYNKRLVQVAKMIGKSIDDVLIKVILKDLENKNSSSYKEVVSQNLINLEFFATSARQIEIFLNQSDNELIQRTRVPSCEIKLTAAPSFKAAKSKAEESVFSLVDEKVESLLDMIEFDWSTKELRDEPVDEIKYLGMFIDSIFKTDFSNLPYSIKTLLLIRTFDRLVTRFKTAIFNVDLITNESVLNFEKDIEYIESVITDLKANQDKDTLELDNTNNLNLQEMVVSLNQIVELLKDGKLESYIEDVNTRFNTINKEDATQLISKLEEFQMATREPEFTPSRTPSQAGTDDGDNKSIFATLKRSATSSSFASSSSPKYTSPKYSMFSFNKRNT